MVFLQVSLMEQTLFQSIRLREFIRQAWAKSESQHKAKNLLAYITHFNHVRPRATPSHLFLLAFFGNSLVPFALWKTEGKEDRRCGR
jgi:hypothetical protein